MEAKTRQIMQWVAARLKEPSTWQGITIMMVAVGVNLEPKLMQAIITLGMGVSSFIFIVTEEKK